MTLVIPLRTRSIYVFHNEALRIDRIAIKGYAVSPERGRGARYRQFVAARAIVSRG